MVAHKPLIGQKGRQIHGDKAHYEWYDHVLAVTVGDVTQQTLLLREEGNPRHRGRYPAARARATSHIGASFIRFARRVARSIGRVQAPASWKSSSVWLSTSTPCLASHSTGSTATPSTWTSKCTCDPNELPVLPAAATTSPALTLSPTET